MNLLKCYLSNAYKKFQHRSNTGDILLQTKLTVNVTNLIGNFILIMQWLFTFQSTK